MKKVFCLTLAAACALSVAALGFSACGEESSDIVTSDEWTAAMEEVNALNVTVWYEKTSSASSSSVTSTSMTVTQEIKNALAEDDNGNITGNTYWYSTDTERSGTATETTYEETATKTRYEVFEADSYSYVEKTTRTGYADYWYGSQYSYAGESDSSDAYSEVAGYITEFASKYSKFTYSSGAYVYAVQSATHTDTYYYSETYYVKINDGYVSSIVVEESGTLASYSYEYSYTYKFYDYGTTTVTVPDEFTYTYYLEHNAS